MNKEHTHHILRLHLRSTIEEANGQQSFNNVCSSHRDGYVVRVDPKGVQR